mmetsp:Transcript_84154/g.167953  ORF Transcript_84154/g.167953 Transcript_84154/m.167953 type:complete len:302 (+) Transcript_84154:233-1138(+)
MDNVHREHVVEGQPGDEGVEELEGAHKGLGFAGGVDVQPEVVDLEHDAVGTLLGPEVRHELHREALGCAAHAVNKEVHNRVGVRVGLHPVLKHEPPGDGHRVASVGDLVDQQRVEVVAYLFAPVGERRLGHLAALGAAPPHGGKVLGLDTVEVSGVDVVNGMLEHALKLPRALCGEAALLLRRRGLGEALVEGVLKCCARRHVPHLVALCRQLHRVLHGEVALTVINQRLLVLQGELLLGARRRGERGGLAEHELERVLRHRGHHAPAYTRGHLPLEHRLIEQHLHVGHLPSISQSVSQST